MLILLYMRQEQKARKLWDVSMMDVVGGLLYLHLGLIAVICLDYGDENSGSNSGAES